MKRKRVTVLTAGHLSTCPRMLKAADALSDEGYEVHVVATMSTDWAASADEVVLAKRKDRFRSTNVDYRRATAPRVYLWSGLRHRLARVLAGGSAGDAVTFRAFARVHDELVRAAVATKADFYYGGTTGGLAATREAARSSGVPYALDLEDFHSGEYPDGSLDERLAERIEKTVLEGAALLTTSSGAIAGAYRERYDVEPVTIHNTFPLPDPPPDLDGRREGPLRLYWFSQTIGPGRGIEQAIEACARVDAATELHLRGNMQPSFRETLSRLAAAAPRLELRVHAPAPLDDMTALCAGYDVGLALEQDLNRNRPLCVTNKILTYPLAGLAVAMTDTPGHRPLVEAFAGKAVVCRPGDAAGLADGLQRLASDPERLREFRRHAFRVAERRWHWEHPDERGKLLASVARALV